MNHFWHILFLGIAFFQMLFIITQWFLFGRKEYLFYIAYIFFAGIYIFFRLHAATGLLNLPIHPWLMEWLDQPMAIFSYYMYLLFTRHFLSLKHTQRKVYRYSRVIEILFLVFLVAKTASIPLELSTVLSAYIYMGYVLVIVALVVPMVVLMLKQKNTLNNFLVMGSVFYIGGGVVGLFVAISNPATANKNITVLLGMEIGILAELLLLNTGFVLKNRIMQQQVIKGQQELLDQMMEEKRNLFRNN